MNALIDLTTCSEYMTINIGGQDHQIKLSGTIEDPYFCGKDICKVLGYTDIKKALQKHVKSKHKKELSELWSKETPLTYHSGKAVYFNKKGLEQLIARSRLCGPDVLQKLTEEFSLNLSITPRDEHVHIEAIERAFSDLKMYKQFKVGNYRTDLYIEEYDLVIECDEHNHTDRDPQTEKTREEYIKFRLQCDFIRFNPDAKNFSIFTVINTIHKHIMKKKDDEMRKKMAKKDSEMRKKENETRKKIAEKDDEIKNLKWTIKSQEKSLVKKNQKIKILKEQLE